MLTSFTTWFTPTSLFILINAVIATIAIISRFAADKSHHHHLAGPTLLRPPSFLERVKSFNYSPCSYNSDHQPNPDPDPPTRPTRSPSMLDRVKSIVLREPETPQPAAAEQSPEETHHDHSVIRSKSDTGTLTPAISLRRRLQKSLSEKLLPWAAEPETGEELVSEIERRRPATMRAEVDEEEEEVDVRADNFINKFKQQLKLQRLESLLRYRDMIKGNK